MAQQIDWLRDWDRPFLWPGLSPAQIASEKTKIEDYVTAMLGLWDKGWQIVHKRAKSHTVTFDWHESSSGTSFIVTAKLSPPPKEGIDGGGGGSLLSPTPPPQP